MNNAPSPEKPQVGSRLLQLAAVWMCVIQLAGCVTTLDKAKQSAAMSQRLYVAVQEQVTSQIVEIAKKDDAAILPDDRARLKTLNELRKALDEYSSVHNAFVSALQVWESSQTKPEQMDETAAKMLALVSRIQSLAKQLNIKVK